MTTDTGRARRPAVDGWFTLDGEPALLGSRCTGCGTYAFPAQEGFCRNPACTSTEHTPTPLSRHGTIWSYTDARYQPPAPFVAPDPYPYVPFAIAAVELAAEQMVILGQMVAGVGTDGLRVGMPVELVVDTLYADPERGDDVVVWKWKPAGGTPASTTGSTTGSTPGGGDHGA